MNPCLFVSMAAQRRLARNARGRSIPCSDHHERNARQRRGGRHSNAKPFDRNRSSMIVGDAIRSWHLAAAFYRWRIRAWDPTEVQYRR